MLAITEIKSSPKALVPRPRLLSLREAVVLAGVSEKEKCVRNDIADGCIAHASVYRLDDMRLVFTWPFVISFAAAYGNEFLVSREIRGAVFNKVFLVASGATGHCPAYHLDSASDVHSWNRSLCDYISCHERLDVDRYLSVNLARACSDVKPRIDVYADGLARVEEDDSILGGNAVFKGTRLPVMHIGKMAERGVPVEEIIEDYNVLTEGDVEFARLYFNACPAVGRPPLPKEDKKNDELCHG